MEIIKFATVCLCLISILAYVSNPSDAAVLPNDVARSYIRGPKLLSSDGNSKELKNASRVVPKRDCGDMVSRSECSQNPKCRWCRSGALDDMCFSKSEAWRLPSQVFSCEF